MAVDILSYQNYRKMLSDMILNAQPKHGYISRMAKYVKCHRSVFPQVLSEKVDLSEDQAARLGEFWGLKLWEQEYFLILVQIERAQTNSLRAMLERRKCEIAEKQKTLVGKIEGEDWADKKLDAGIYYSSWLVGAIHIAISIPGLNSFAALAERLDVSTTSVQAAIKKLIRLGLIEKADQGWKVTKRKLHISKESMWHGANVRNWRLKAATHIDQPDPDDLHYSGLYAASRSTFNKVQKLLNESIVETHELIAESPEEEIFCLNLDLFKI